MPHSLHSIVNLSRLAKGDEHLQTAYATMFTEKYGSIIVMETMTYAQALPLYGGCTWGRRELVMLSMLFFEKKRIFAHT